MGAVLENVASGHCGIAESMNENGFKFTFQEVNGQKPADQQLEIRWLWKRLIEVVVEVRPKREEEKRRDMEGAKVFDNENGTPSDLRA